MDALDWSHWHIEVSNPKQTYWLNHYPKFSHTIYKEDFEATIPVAAGATVVIRVIDGNDRQIDNGKPGPDRQQTIAGVADEPRAGQMLRLDVSASKRADLTSPASGRRARWCRRRAARTTTRTRPERCEPASKKMAIWLTPVSMSMVWAPPDR